MNPRLALLAVAVLTLSGCAAGEATPDQATSQNGTLDVTVAAYPYEYLAQRIGGTDVQVTALTRPGVEPHDLELTPQQVGALGSTDLVVLSSGFQPAVDEAVEQQAGDRAFDVNDTVELRPGASDEHEGEAEEHGDEAEEHGAEEALDPHLWLDPERFAAVGQALADRLGELRPDRAEQFTARADALAADLTALDDEFRTGLTGCARTEIVTTHEAFGYLTSRYGLEQVGISGLSPEAEPSARRLAEVAELARANGVTTIFFEELVSPRVAESLAREVGAATAVLTPLESPPDDGDYLTAMRANLTALRTALDCP